MRSSRTPFDPDWLVSELDKAVRTLFGDPVASRPNPSDTAAGDNLDGAARRHAAALMRVNHCGEVCAQALYQGQALASTDGTIRGALEKAAKEECDHLAWSAERVRELGGRLSLLNPLWYAGSLALGYIAGRLGEEWNLGFLAETERQVEQHLEGHLQRLAAHDTRTRTIIERMQKEEAEHRRTAERLGARQLPDAARRAMRMAARVMTTLSHRI